MPKYKVMAQVSSQIDACFIEADSLNEACEIADEMDLDVFPVGDWVVNNMTVELYDEQPRIG